MKRKKQNNKKNKYLLLSLLLLLAVGYAIIATTLDINGFTAFKGVKWKVYWDDVNVTTGSVEGSADITGDKKTSIVVNASFEALGEYFEFTADMVNDGDYNAEIDTITTNFYEVEDEEETEIEKPSYINYSYTYENGDKVKKGNVLNKGKRKKCKIRVSMIEDVDSVDDLPDETELKTVITITYKKSDKRSVVLKKGSDVANIMYNLAYNANKDDIGDLYVEGDYDNWRYQNIFYKISDYIEHFKMATEEQYNEVKDSLTSDNIISLTTEAPSSDMIQIATSAAVSADEEDADPVYMWYDTDTKTIYYYSDLDVIELNQDASYMFYGLKRAEDIELTKFSTENVENMSYMFKLDGNYYLNYLNVSKFSTSNVTNMRYMFSGLDDVDVLNVANFDTSNVTDMSNMFNDCGDIVSLNLSKWDTSNVTNMKGMFYDCDDLSNVNLSSFDTSNVTDMSYMFYDCYNLKNITFSSKFDTRNVETMEKMFYDCYYLTKLDLSSFDTRNVTNMSGMFGYCNELQTIYASNKFVTTNVEDSYDMFYQAQKILGSYGTKYSSSYTDGEYARIDSENTPGYFSEAGIYVIKFNPTDGQIDNQYREIAMGDGLGTLPTVTHGDNEFVGWYTAVTGGEEVTAEYVPTSNIELYARWKYEIKFNANEGSVSETTRDVYSGEILGELPIPTKEGYGFVGWYTGLTDGVKVGRNTIATNSITYYAHWMPLKTITYKSTDGLFENNEDTNIVTYKYFEAEQTNHYSHTSNINDSGVADGSYESNLAENDVIIIDGADSLRIDLWYSTENTSYDWLAIYGAGITPDQSNYGQSITGKLGGGNNNTKEKATHTTLIVPGDTVQFFFRSDGVSEYYGYYAIVTDNSTSGYRATPPYLEPIYGDKVYSWNTEPDGSGTSYLSETEVIADFANIGSSLTLYAQWRDLEEYTITFNPNGGTVSETTRNVMERSEIGTLPIPTNGDDLFIGWYTEITDGIYVDSTYIPSGDKILYARWRNPSSFSTDDWPTIIAAVKAGRTNSYNVGDTKQVDLGSLGVHTLRIANKDTPSACSGSSYSQTACGFVLEFEDIIINKNMNTGSDSSVNGSSNKGGWQYSYMRNYVNNTVYNELPTDLRRGIIDTKVVSGYGRYDSSNFVTTDKLYLLSVKEVYGSNVSSYDSAAGLTHQLKYYSNKYVTSSSYSYARKKLGDNYRYWWLRTAYGYGYFNAIYSSGSVNYYNYANEYGVSPAFRIG